MAQNTIVFDLDAKPHLSRLGVSESCYRWNLTACRVNMSTDEILAVPALLYALLPQA